MAEVKVKVIEEFKDRAEDLKLRKKDEVLTVSEERGQKLAGLGYVEFVEDESVSTSESVAASESASTSVATSESASTSESESENEATITSESEEQSKKRSTKK